ncbi:hypothetical protein GMORB2_1826 [Geosmithia morbida]|uniref:Peptidase M20 dimerisation domain-containing protein n=1 Tax=Geosmithia morbida TaxID=1094350 RepID=A0A9P4YTC9_9HYPO|nr:uncharacterized protein GMORB2_1826 [Geosmithia morbida]KAF4121419.1 hypothetical protein GMORB2_1826 [Geosmithia morbida]
MEKNRLAWESGPWGAGNSRPQARKSLLGLVALVLFIGLVFTPFPYSHAPNRILGSFRENSYNAYDSWCPLSDPVVSHNDSLKESEHLFSDVQRSLQVKRLSTAVRVPTESYDDNGEVDEDPRWETFLKFHSVLEHLFPLVHSQLELRKVNRFGLHYEWKGSDDLLKPILFMAHQDVVPADAGSAWTYPPYDGYYDGTFVWGRGAADCKNVLIGILSVIEDLISQSFQPRRTIVLSFGFDEETGGERGATKLSEALVEKWGPDSFLFILDEGGMGLQTVGDILYAYPAVGEKGYYDVQVTLGVQGGHSSKPPPHSGIGIMSDAVLALEGKTYSPRLPKWSPFRRVLECKAKHSPDKVQPWLRESLLHDREEEIARKLSDEIGEEKWLMQTSQAVDVISGGIKVNALPETVKVSINHRIAIHESQDNVNQHIRQVLEPIAEKYGLVFKGIDPPGEGPDVDDIDITGTLELSVLQTLPIAPLSPTDNNVWAIFSGTLRSVFESTESGKGKTVVPVGNVMTGNTDTTHYWDLTHNIYRYSPARDGTRLNVHAIDERMEITAHLEGMRLYYDLIRNFDSWDDDE